MRFMQNNLWFPSLIWQLCWTQDYWWRNWVSCLHKHSSSDKVRTFFFFHWNSLEIRSQCMWYCRSKGTVQDILLSRSKCYLRLLHLFDNYAISKRFCACCDRTPCCKEWPYTLFLIMSKLNYQDKWNTSHSQ